MTQRILDQLEKAGPYRISASRLVSIKTEAEALGFPLFSISAQKSASTAEWLQALAQVLNFPAHFGNNFDALYDCLCDREVTPQTAIVLIIDHSETLSEEASDTLIAVLQAVADEWREQQRPFWVLFTAPGLDLDPLPLK
jgi:RNAse (barnase) inhibitor barstar